ncbi:Lateral organ boundaries domain containing protein [Trema orientale]|uniref:Lateral organ boundaries domain containing protein n=1 Tax=Trema orientale TaxID=63057 RepID=A0A2P5BIY5_TREOI|nr:Lateral organ boundaries domain containing protein [Trema orientale]
MAVSRASDQRVHQPCAGCRHQRKKCEERCELAPYFPARKFKEYKNAHRVFGTSNIYRIMAAVEPDQRQATADSILLEGNARRSDPVRGCYGVLRTLRSQLSFHEKQLRTVNQHLAYYRERENNILKRQDLDMKRHPFSINTSISTTTIMSPSSGPSAQFLHHDDQTSDLDGFRFPQEIVDLSTLEESADLKPFDLELIDQMMESYNHHEDKAFASNAESRKSSTGFNENGTLIVKDEKSAEEE